jgi:hypothetical protein
MRWFRGKSSQPRREIAPVKHRKFDDQTGQIYTETTSMAATQPDDDWHHRSRCSGEWIESDWRDDFAIAKRAPLVKVSPKTTSNTRNPRTLNASGKLGSRSLVETAMESILQKVKDLSIEVLQDMPPILLQKVWDQIRARLVQQIMFKLESVNLA